MRINVHPNTHRVTTWYASLGSAGARMTLPSRMEREKFGAALQRILTVERLLERAEVVVAMLE